MMSNCNIHLTAIKFSRLNIKETCRVLPPKSARGVDGVAVKLLRNCNRSLSLPFLMWNDPADMLMTITFPLYKGGSLALP